MARSLVRRRYGRIGEIAESLRKARAGSRPFSTVEVGLTGALVAFGGKNAQVVAAVLVYRVLSTVPTPLIGLVASATWRHIDPPPPEAAG